jgi:AraC-like DNA-binding protein
MGLLCTQPRLRVLNLRDSGGVRSPLVTQELIEPSILRPRSALQHFDYQRHGPAAPLGELIEHFWTVTWALSPGESYTAQTLPYPSVNLSVTNTEADVTGLTRRCYYRHLEGSGYAIGARFRPGCFRPLVDSPVSVLTNRHRPIAEVLDRSTEHLQAQIADLTDTRSRVDALAAFLAEGWPAPDATAQQLAELVERIAGDRTITRVAQVAGLADLTVRSLQRIFADYVGAGPKWVIQRCRLQDAAARVAVETIDWASLAEELGFADQAHLTRAFTATIGVPPATYARQASSG